MTIEDALHFEQLEYLVHKATFNPADIARRREVVQARGRSRNQV